ncbi:MAG: T9SS type A sorting domain-containing protein, partial [Bacteroidota bacterium]
GCTYFSNTIASVKNPNEKPSLEIEGEIPVCEGLTIGLFLNTDLSDIMWSNGLMEQSIDVTQEGSYFATVQGTCQSFNSDTIEVKFLPRPELELMTDSIEIGDTAMISAIGGDRIRWVDAEQDTLMGIGTELSIPNLDSSFVVLAISELSYAQDTFEVGEAFATSNGFSNNSVSSGLLFEVFEPCIIHSVRVGTDTAAKRTIQIENAVGGDIYASKDVFISEEDERIELNITIEEPGLYVINTNIDSNFINLGYFSPRLLRTDEISNYPYKAEDILSISSASQGSNFYFYFYDWEVSKTDKICSSSALIEVFVDQRISSENFHLDVFEVFPNPVKELLFVRGSLPIENIKLFDVHGRAVLNENYNGVIQANLDLNILDSGIYFIEIKSFNKIEKAKILIQK